MAQLSPDDGEKDPRVPRVPNPRLTQVQSLRELARTWYSLSVACRRIGAMIERVSKNILYETINSPSTGEIDNDE